VAEARTLYDRLLKVEPDNREAWANLGSSCHQLGEFAAAIAAYDAALGRYDGSAEQEGAAAIVSQLHENVGRAWLALGKKTQQDEQKQAAERHAETAFEKSLAANPQNVVAQHLLRSLRGDDEAEADPTYVATLFDSFSTSFEKELAALNYCTPEKIAAHLRGASSSSSAVDVAVDLGCGTGLMGQLLRQFGLANTIVGVDLSPAMLAKVEETKEGVYNHLFCGGVQPFLDALAAFRGGRAVRNGRVRRKLSGGVMRYVEEVRGDGDDFGGAFAGGIFDDPAASVRVAVTAADVFCYFGDLSPVMASVAALCRAGDVFIFSCEELPPSDDDGDGAGTQKQRTVDVGVDGDAAAPRNTPVVRRPWKLQKTGRFAHKSQYIREMLHEFPTFRLRALEHYVPRRDSGMDVAGLLAVVDVV